MPDPSAKESLGVDVEPIPIVLSDISNDVVLIIVCVPFTVKFVKVTDEPTILPTLISGPPDKPVAVPVRLP